ncbi:hypothetical protein HDU99_000604, partial [Rhizoclosmatium hyalinum]
LRVGAEQKWGPFTFTGHSGSVMTVAISQDSQILVSTADDSVKFWSLQTGECIKTL